MAQAGMQPCLAIAPPPQQRAQLHIREGVPLGQHECTAGAAGIAGCAGPPGGCRQGRHWLAATLLGSLEGLRAGRCRLAAEVVSRDLGGTASRAGAGWMPHC